MYTFSIQVITPQPHKTKIFKIRLPKITAFLNSCYDNKGELNVYPFNDAEFKKYLSKTLRVRGYNEYIGLRLCKDTIKKRLQNED